MGEVETEKSVEAWAQVGVPTNMGVRWKRTVIERETRFIDKVERTADIGRNELIERLDHDEAVRDAFAAGLERASEVADAAYREALAHAVAAALDDAWVDEAAHTVNQLVRLEPIHLRVLMCLFDYHRITQLPGGGERHTSVELSDADGALTQPRNLNELLRMLAPASEPIILATIQGLMAGGLVQEHEGPRQIDRERGNDPFYKAPTPPNAWIPTDWGHAALLRMFPTLQATSRR